LVILLPKIFPTARSNAPNLKAERDTTISGKDVIGWIYSVHPVVCKNFDTKADVGAFEINYTKLAALGRKETAYASLPKFPGINIDISVVVNRKARAEDVKATIAKSDEQLIESVELFDIFEDEQLGKDKKSLAFSVYLQADDRTLTDNDMKETQQKIVANLEKAGGEVRR